MKENKNLIGIIGGSGLYHMKGLVNTREEFFETPFGKPSDKLVFGEINGKEFVFIPRHGKGHKILPSEINYAANIYALKAVGVKKIISVSAVGSLKENIKPGDMIVIDQFVDFTKTRKSTFFGDGLVAHVSMAEPVCPYLSRIVVNSCKSLGIPCHEKGTYLCIEGPQFSTKAESLFYQKSNFDVIGMTNATEAKLAKESELCYITIAMATDYDCWHDEEDNVTADMILKILNENARKAEDIIKDTANIIDFNEKECTCGSSLRQAVVTSEEDVPNKTMERLSIFNLYDR